MTTRSEEIDFVVFYVFSAIAIAANVGVFIYMKLKYPSQALVSALNPFLRIVLLLHLSNICECITLLPYVFQFNRGFCVFMEAVKFYFGLMNIWIIFIIIQIHRIAIIYNVNAFTEKVRRCAAFMVFVFPLIAFLPFTDGSFMYPSTPWCSLPSGASIAWALCIQYFWVWFVLFTALLSNLYMLYVVLIKNKNAVLFRKYAFNCGAFSFISGLSWIPRTWEFFQTHDSIEKRFTQYIPAVIAAILYCVLFAINEEAITRYQDESEREETIIWDASDIFNSIGEDLSRLTFGGSVSIRKLSESGSALEKTAPAKKNPFLLRPSFFLPSQPLAAQQELPNRTNNTPSVETDGSRA